MTLPRRPALLILLPLLLLSLPVAAQQSPDDDLTVERMPVMRTECPQDDAYKDCVSRTFLEYVYGRLEYPKRARKLGREGMVVVSYVVERNGTLSSFQIVRDPGYGMGKEVVRVLETLNANGPSFIPGIQGGEYVRVQFNLPVNFSLGGADEGRR